MFLVGLINVANTTVCRFWMCKMSVRYLIEREKERREERECYRVGFCSVLPFYRVGEKQREFFWMNTKRNKEACILLAL